MQSEAFNSRSKPGAVMADFIALIVLALGAGVAASMVLGGIVLLLTSEARAGDRWEVTPDQACAHAVQRRLTGYAPYAGDCAPPADARARG